MDDIALTAVGPDIHQEARWAVAGRFLDALTRRDFSELEACLHPEIRFRALVPRGPFELNTALETVARFRTWFGEAPVFEVLEASVGQVGDRLYLQWRARRGDPRAPA